MKKNDIVELRSKTRDELLRMLTDLREEVQKMGIDKAQGKLKNLNAVKRKKKDVARVLTFIKMKTEVITEEVKEVAAAK